MLSLQASRMRAWLTLSYKKIRLSARRSTIRSKKKIQDFRFEDFNLFCSPYRNKPEPLNGKHEGFGGYSLIGHAHIEE